MKELVTNKIVPCEKIHEDKLKTHIAVFLLHSSRTLALLKVVTQLDLLVKQNLRHAVSPLR